MATAASMSDGFSKPTNIKLPSGKDIAFALSYSETASFCSSVHDVRGGPPEYVDSSAIAKANAGKLDIPLNYGPWLRTMGDLPNEAGILHNQSPCGPRAFQQQDSNKFGLVYPALWVDSSIFD